MSAAAASRSSSRVAAVASSDMGLLSARMRMNVDWLVARRYASAAGVPGFRIAHDPDHS